ncbi:hypothetical protein LshimejAT787_1402500 [Lyophyllum shimeji]|uniref:Uncharacterized protein n=1 Tax=Lyophyllum shimeji TaxID=47721 RepID=A0A9P3PXE3_LYOSH|nr:hypothetical protein LshimejAT787_1402500 [Lyophyllum shimeji]
MPLRTRQNCRKYSGNSALGTPRCLLTRLLSNERGGGPEPASILNTSRLGSKWVPPPGPEIVIVECVPTEGLGIRQRENAMKRCANFALVLGHNVTSIRRTTHISFKSFLL